VVVAAAAAHRQAQERRGRRLDAVDDAFDAPLLVDDAALGVHPVVAVEPRRDLLRLRRVGQQIAGDLFDGELIERHVLVVGVDDPVAPVRHEALGVGLIPMRVGVARRVEPRDGHLLAVMG
jgi:hypothetical protein